MALNGKKKEALITAFNNKRVSVLNFYNRENGLAIKPNPRLPRLRTASFSCWLWSVSTKFWKSWRMSSCRQWQQEKLKYLVYNNSIRVQSIFGSKRVESCRTAANQYAYLKIIVNHQSRVVLPPQKNRLNIPEITSTTAVIDQQKVVSILLNGTRLFHKSPPKNWISWRSKVLADLSSTVSTIRWTFFNFHWFLNTDCVEFWIDSGSWKDLTI